MRQEWAAGSERRAVLMTGAGELRHVHGRADRGAQGSRAHGLCMAVASSGRLEGRNWV